MTSRRLGRQTVALLRPPSVVSYANVGGKFEANGPLAGHFDLLCTDSFFGKDTWEQAESAMQQEALTRALEKSKLEKAAYSLILSLARVGLYLLLGLSLATSLGIDVTGVVALASVLTLAVSLALQNMLTNVLGGFTLLTTHPFHSGDYVDIGGQSGTVTQIDMSYTRLVTVDNKVVCIPNSTVLASEVVNYSANDTRRAEIQVSAGYDAPTQKVIDALALAATVDNALLEPAPFAAVVSYGDNAINYTLRFWAKTEDYWDVYFKVNQRVKDIFDEQGIPMTYPHLNVHFDKEFLESRKNG